MKKFESTVPETNQEESEEIDLGEERSDQEDWVDEHEEAEEEEGQSEFDTSSNDHAEEREAAINTIKKHSKLVDQNPSRSLKYIDKFIRSLLVVKFPSTQIV